MSSERTVRIVGPGRAGGSFAGALARVGWRVEPALGRSDEIGDAADDVDLVLITTPDRSVAEVAARITPVPTAVVAHVAGSLGLAACAPHHRRAAIHPLVALPSAERGADRLAANAWFAVAGDPIAVELVEALGGRWFTVADDDRARYHAAACVAANHLVALLGQVERIAAAIDVPVAPYIDLARGAIDNVADLGAAAALTGPAARGDDATIAGHLDSLDPSEVATYQAMVEEARRLARQDEPPRGS